MNSKPVKSALCFGAVAALFVCVPSISLAQEVEEVIIEAESIEDESLNDLVSVSALSGEKLADAGIENVEDVAAYVPNLVLTETDTGTNIVIRGIGAGVNQGFDQSVGLYIDGVPLPRSQMARAPFLDLDNLQVLRGPQYVMDGNYSIAGSVHMITKQSAGELSAGLDVNYIPSQNEKKLLLTGDLPVGDAGGIRLAIQRQTSDGYVENVTRREDGPQKDELLVRLVAGWQPTDSLSIKLKAEQGQFDSRGRQIEVILDDPTPTVNTFGGVRGARNTSPTSFLVSDYWDDDYFALRPKRIFYDVGDGAVGGPLATQPFYFSGFGYLDRIHQNYIEGLPGGLIAADPSLNYAGEIPAGLLDDELNYKRGADADEFSNNDSENYTLNLDYYLGETSLKLTSSFIKYEVEELVDGDFTAAPMIETRQSEEYEQLFHRIDIATPEGEFIEWKIGASYLEGDLVYRDQSGGVFEQPDSYSTADILDFQTAANLNNRTLSFNPDFPLATLLGRITGLNGGRAVVRGFELFRPDRIFEQENEIAAGFIQAKINWSDTVRTTLGLRYTHSEKQAVRDVALVLPNGELLDFNTTTDPDEVRDLVQLFSRGASALSSFFSIQSTTDRYGIIEERGSGANRFEAQAVNDINTTLVPALRGSRREEQLLPSFSLEWDVTPDLTILSSVRMANKLGGFDARANAAPEAPAGVGIFPGTFEFEDESALTYELGMKWYLPDGYGELLATGFFTEFKDLQVSRSDGRLGFGVDNAGVAHVKGIEIEGFLQPTDAFSINYSLAYIDFEFQEYLRGTCPRDRRPDNYIVNVTTFPELSVGQVLQILYGDDAVQVAPQNAGDYTGIKIDPVTGTQFDVNNNVVTPSFNDFDDFQTASPAFCDFAGQTNQYVAEWQGTVTFNYETGLVGTSAYFKPTLDVIYNSGYHTTVSQESAVEQEAFTQFNGRLAIVDEDGIWEVALTGENLTNEKIVTYAAELPIGARIQGANSFYGFVRPPRSIGMNLRYNFY